MEMKVLEVLELVFKLNYIISVELYFTTVKYVRILAGYGLTKKIQDRTRGSYLLDHLFTNYVPNRYKVSIK